MTPYMDAVFSKQRQFNAQCMRSLEALLDMITKERERSYRGGLDRYAAWVEMGLKEELDSLQEEVLEQLPPDRSIIELGCGMGEFLVMAREKGREVLGVEEDPRLVRLCQENNARVVHSNVLDYLDAMSSKSMDAVFVMDMGERGSMQELLWMVTALADKIEREGILVALNHNPRSAWGVEEAFLDPSMLRMVHPETLDNLLRQAGFSEVEVNMVGEYSEDDLKKARAALGGLAELNQGDIADLLFAPSRYIVRARR